MKATGGGLQAFEQYCTPVGDGSQLLCDRRLRFLAFGSVDIEEALAVAATGTSSVINEEEELNSVEKETPIIVNQPSSDNEYISTIAASKSQPEVFPLILGSVLMVASVVFTVFILLVVLQKWRTNHTHTDERKRSTRSDQFDNSDSLGGIESDDMGIDNSWVYGKRTHLSIMNQGGTDVGQQQHQAIVDETGEDVAIMSWKDLSCTYPSKRSGGADITTLSNVTGYMQHKELVAIMGPSGGGKTTMMDILSGRKSLGKLGGQISIMGKEIETKSTSCRDILKDIVAYVPQNESFFPNQTPEEAVEFVASLKLGEDERGDDVRKKRVGQILDIVGISSEARKRAIGGTLAGGVVIRGLSGGERKRLALACAVAMKPRLLFLDEITSGLDSENAIMVIDLIKKLCMNLNAAAAVVIHQPSYEVLSQFDRLILLSKGKCLFSDKFDCIQDFYAQISRPLPEKHLLSGDLLNVASRWDQNIDQQNNELAKTCGLSLLKDIAERKKVSAFLQLKTVLLRQMMNHYVRNLTNLLARLVIYGGTSLILGLVFWKIAETEDGQPLTYEQAEATFGAGIFLTQIYYLLPFCQISTFFFDKALFASESSIGLYPAWVYSLSQIILEVWVMVLCALAQTAVSVPMISLWNPRFSKLASFTTMFSVFCVGGIVGNAIVVLTSLAVSSQDIAFLIGSANVVVSLAASGGFVPFPYLEDWIKWLQWISPIKYSFQAFTWALLSETPTSDLLETLELDTPANVGLNLLILIGIFAFCALCSVFALSRQREVR